MPYDKDGKYYRQPTNSINKDKKSSKLTPEQEAKAIRFKSQLKGGIAFIVIGWIVIIGGVIYLVSDAVKEKPKTGDRLKIEKLARCRTFIKGNLKNPSSFKVVNDIFSQKLFGIIDYTATNSFGARVKESYKCFDPNRLR